MTVEVASVTADGLRAPLALLEKSLRAGEPLPDTFIARLRTAVNRGELEVLAARDATGKTVGVAVLAYRLNVSAGDRFASVEELYVEPEARREGIGKALLDTAAERCREQSASYVEVQVEEDGAGSFYAAAGYELEAARVMSRSLPLGDQLEGWSNSSTS